MIVEVETFNVSGRVPCDEGWVYDRTQYKTTITSDFDLVCDKKKLPNIAQAMFFAGILIGSVLYGTIADKLGRRVGLFATTVSTAISGILVSVSPSIVMYMIMRFFLGASSYNTLLTAFVLVSEIVGPSKRVFTGINIEYSFAFGIMLLSVLAYFIRTWRILQLVITLPGFLTLLLLPFIPESPRWLLSKGRTKEAQRIISKTARFNKVNISKDFLEELTMDEEKGEESPERSSFSELLRIPSMRNRTLNIMYNWFVQSFVYYGFTLSTGDLGVNIYIGLFISGAVEGIAYAVDMYLIEKIGRRLSLSGLLFLAGISCFPVIVIPAGVARIVVGMIGKFSISATFAIVFVYTAELYPTPLRGTAVGICSFTSKTGGMLCPLVFLLSAIWIPLPMTLFASASILAALLTLLLPETRGCPLPETVMEADQLGRKRIQVPTTDENIDV